MFLALVMCFIEPVNDDFHTPNIDPYQQTAPPPADTGVVPPVDTGDAGEGGVKARAMYDYQASKFLLRAILESLLLLNADCSFSSYSYY